MMEERNVLPQHGGDIYSHKVELDFSASINPLGMPARVREAAIRGIEDSVHYPDPAARELTRAYARARGVPESAVIFGNGASELIRALCSALAGDLAGRKLRAAAAVPCFPEYLDAARQAGSELLMDGVYPAGSAGLPSGRCRNFTAGGMELDLYFIANPASPTGQVTERRRLTELISCHPATVVCVDESFLPFSDREDGLTLLPLVHRCRSLVVLRSFTKIYAMPGLRLGALVSSDEQLLRRIRGFLQPWNVSLPAQRAGTAALEEDAFVQKSVSFIRREREFLTAELEESSADRVFHGEANYVFFHWPDREPGDLGRQLMARGILIRDCSNMPGITQSGYYRVAVRSRDDNVRLLEAIRAAAV